MPTFSNKRRVPFSTEQMYALVADVERYPEFLPWCERLTVISRRPIDGGTELTATMTVGYKAIRESFATRVVCRPAEQAIDVFYLDGPFRYLENRWRFLPVNGGSEIDFFITYEFRSAMLGLIVGALFDRAFRRFAEAFEDRAHDIYSGRPVSA